MAMPFQSESLPVKQIKQVMDHEDCESDDLDFDLDEFELIDDNQLETPLDLVDPFIVVGHTMHVMLTTRKEEYDHWLGLLRVELRNILEKIYQAYVEHLQHAQQETIN